MKKWIFFILAALTVVLAACSSDETKTKTNNDALTVYTTVYPLQYFTEQIGGDYVDVKSIYPAGANEHTFEPTQKDMMYLADADVFFYIGLGLEGFVEKSKSTLENENVQLVATAAAITEEELHISTGHVHAEGEEHEHEHEHEEEHEHEDSVHEEDEHAHEEHDSHVWLSPVLSEKLALAIKDELVKQLPAHEELFNENYEQLVANLQQLDADFKQMADEVSNDTFFVSHAAFGYIAGHYGFTQVPVAGLNSQSEPSQKELTQIVDLAKEKNIDTIFFEQNVNSNLTEVIQKEIGADTATLHNLSVLTNEDIQQNETYFSLMEKNIEALRKALK